MYEPSNAIDTVTKQRRARDIEDGRSRGPWPYSVRHSHGGSLWSSCFERIFDRSGAIYKKNDTVVRILTRCCWAYTNQTHVSMRTRNNVSSRPNGIKGKKYVFVHPSLVAEITYGAWTHDGKLRHASFKGFREDADHSKVYDLSTQAES
jgi:hypothetical protein